MAKEKKYVIGIDLGGTKLLVTLLNRRFQRLAEIKTKTRLQKGSGHFFETLRDSIEYVLDEAKVSRSEVVGIGLGCPGIVDDKRGVVVTSPNIPFLKGLPLARNLSTRIHIPVVLGNDVKMGLYGEQQFGAAKGSQNVLGIFIGTGIGGAMILDGKLYMGTSGGAGEIGHLLLDPYGPVCGCGQRGCFEAMVARPAIAAEAALLAGRQKAPYLFQEAGTDIANMKSGALAKAIRSGDRAIADLIRRKAQLVGLVAANMVNLLNPEMIVLGGGVVEAMPILLVKEAERAMRERAMGPLAARVKMVPAKLGDYSVAMGAAKRAADRLGGHHVS